MHETVKYTNTKLLKHLRSIYVRPVKFTHPWCIASSRVDTVAWHTVGSAFSARDSSTRPLFISFHLCRSRSFPFPNRRAHRLALSPTTQILPFTNGCQRAPLTFPLPCVRLISTPRRVWIGFLRCSSLMRLKPAGSLSLIDFLMCSVVSLNNCAETHPYRVCLQMNS